jgi:hypothetical protein
MLILQVMLGRPLRISFALEKVRGAPVIVPRLSTVRKFNSLQVYSLPGSRNVPANNLVYRNIVFNDFLAFAYLKSFYKSNKIFVNCNKLNF